MDCAIKQERINSLETLLRAEHQRANDLLGMLNDEKEENRDRQHIFNQYLGLVPGEAREDLAKEHKPLGGYRSARVRAREFSQTSLRKRTENAGKEKV